MCNGRLIKAYMDLARFHSHNFKCKKLCQITKWHNEYKWSTSKHKGAKLWEILCDNKAIQMVSVVLHFVLELGDQEPIDLPVQVAHSCASATAQHSPSFWPFQIVLQYVTFSDQRNQLFPNISYNI